MWEVLRCPVGKEFYVTASFDDELKHGKLKTVSVRLHRTGEDGKVLASKSFAWPEPKFPSEVNFDESSGFLLFKGASNIAQVPFQLTESAIARLSPASSSKATLYSSLSFDTTECQPAIVTTILEIVNRTDIEENWSSLYSLCENEDGDLLPIGMFLSATDQDSFLNLVFERTKREKNYRILCSLLRQNVFSSQGLDSSVVKFCSDELSFEPVFCLLQYSKIIAEDAYARCLKLAVHRLGSDGKKLLREVMKKPFTKEKLSSSISEILSEDDAILLVDELVALLKRDHSESQFTEALNLLCTVMDSQAQRLIWNEKSKKSLSSATELVTDLMQSLDVFSNFDSKLKQRKMLGAKLCDEPRRSDYSIRKVAFKLKFI